MFPALLAACSPVDQEGRGAAAAVEIVLRSTADRNDLLAMLRRHAAADGGLHVDDESAGWREFEAQSNMIAPEDRLTINVGVWRGEDDDELEVLVDDRYHPGRAWVMFMRGSQPERSARFREGLLAEMGRRWPDARPLPVLPWGGLPLAKHLVVTPSGYKIAPSAAPRYELPPSSPLVAQ